MNNTKYLLKMRKYLAMIALTTLTSNCNAFTTYAAKVSIEQENSDEHQFFKESAFYQNRYLLNKSDWDAVFAKENYTEEEIRNLVLKRTDLSEEQKQDIIEHLHKEFQAFPNGDFRVLAFNVAHLDYKYDKQFNYMNPFENKIRVSQRLSGQMEELVASHENAHARNLFYVEFLDKNKVTAGKLEGSSFYDNYRGGGLREAFNCLANRKMGYNDLDYGEIQVAWLIIKATYGPENLKDIEWYNDLVSLKTIMLGDIKEEEFQELITITDEIKVYYLSTDKNKKLSKESVKRAYEIVLKAYVKQKGTDEKNLSNLYYIVHGNSNFISPEEFANIYRNVANQTNQLSK